MTLPALAKLAQEATAAHERECPTCSKPDTLPCKQGGRLVTLALHLIVLAAQYGSEVRT